VVIQDPPAAIRSNVQDEKWPILPLSARTEENLQGLVREYIKFINKVNYLLFNTLTYFQEEKLQDVCYSAAVRRSHHEYRAAFTGQTKEELMQHMQSFTACTGKMNLKTVFVFTGQGSQVKFI
jgi:acyl transferase domain-containing protein